MTSLLGLVIVLGAIAGGYLMEQGRIAVLLQPAELVIIFGSAIGTVVVANPVRILKKIVGGIAGVFAGTRFSRDYYLETLKMMYDLFSLSRKGGMAKLEEEVDHPENGQIFSKYPKLTKSGGAMSFLCDTLRMAISGGIDATDIDQMMEVDLEVHQRESQEPIHALTSMADALPGLGIVAAVLGVILTMGALGGPKEAIGEKVAAALVGTFLGILLCYGVFSPIAAAMGKQAEAESAFYGVLRMGSLGFVKDLSPIMAVELARRSIPSQARPTFQEMEDACRGGSGAASKAA
jgi:chemotaxis protein MotA